MDTNVLRILEFLKPFGFTTTVNVAPILNDIFPFKVDDSEFDFNILKRNITRFIQGLINENLITANEDQLYNIGEFRDRNRLNAWFSSRGFEASITRKGLLELSEENKLKIEEEVNKSAIKVNQSIEATNQSVINTNIAIVGLSERQAAILTKQTKIFLYTAVFAFGSLAVSIFTLVKDTPKDVLSNKLRVQIKKTDSIQLLLNREYKKGTPTNSKESNQRKNPN